MPTEEFDEIELEEQMKKHLSINRRQLHVEFESYPDIFNLWGERLAQAIFERDCTKDDVELTTAELASDIRQSPTEYGIDGRVTEAAINAMVIMELKYKKVKKKLNEKQKAVNKLTTGVRAISSKKSALENEVRLYLGNYFSEPITEDRELQQIIDDRGTEATRPRLRLKRRRSAKG